LGVLLTRLALTGPDHDLVTAWAVAVIFVAMGWAATAFRRPIQNVMLLDAF
jgi:hypothetical protein